MIKILKLTIYISLHNINWFTIQVWFFSSFFSWNYNYIKPSTYRIVLSVRNLIQFGIGLFCLAFFPRTRLILNDLLDGYKINPDHKNREIHKSRILFFYWMDGWIRTIFNVKREKVRNEFFVIE